jgi:hypothetical protein
LPAQDAAAQQRADVRALEGDVADGGPGTPLRRAEPKIDPSRSTPARTFCSARMSAAAVEPPSE